MVSPRCLDVLALPKGHDPCVCRGGEGGVGSGVPEGGPFTVSTRRLSSAALKAQGTAAPHSNWMFTGHFTGSRKVSLMQGQSDKCQANSACSYWSFQCASHHARSLRLFLHFFPQKRLLRQIRLFSFYVEKSKIRKSKEVAMDSHTTRRKQSRDLNPGLSGSSPT